MITDAKTAGSNKRDLLAIAAPAAKEGAVALWPPKAPDKYRVEVLHGSDRKVVEF